MFNWSKWKFLRNMYLILLIFPFFERICFFFSLKSFLQTVWIKTKNYPRGQKFTCYRWEPLIQYWFNTGVYDIEHTKRFTTSKDEQLTHCRTGTYSFEKNNFSVSDKGIFRKRITTSPARSWTYYMKF